MYGEKKIGKTSMWQYAPDALYLMFEPGGRSLRLFQTPIRDWYDFLSALDLLEHDTKFRTIVVDTVDIAYDMCFDYTCRKLGIEHPTDERDYGKSWGQIENEFVRPIQRLLSMSKGVVFLSHSRTRDIKTTEQEAAERVEPTMANQAKKYFLSVIDIWAYYGYAADAREIVIRGNEFVGAGCRLEENFRTPNGKPVASIPGGDTSREAYDNFVKAFENKQPYSTAKLCIKKSLDSSKNKVKGE